MVRSVLLSFIPVMLVLIKIHRVWSVQQDIS